MALTSNLSDAAADHGGRGVWSPLEQLRPGRGLAVTSDIPQRSQKYLRNRERHIPPVSGHSFDDK